MKRSANFVYQFLSWAEMTCCGDCKEGKTCKDKKKGGMDIQGLVAKGISAGVAAALYETAFNGIPLTENMMIALWAGGTIIAADLAADKVLGMKYGNGLIGKATEPALAAAGWYLMRNQTGLAGTPQMQLFMQGAGYDLVASYTAPSLIPMVTKVTPSGSSMYFV